MEDSWIRPGSQETTVFGGDSTEEEEEKEEEEDEDNAELAAAQSERRAISQRRQRVVKKEAIEVTVLQEYLEEVRGTCLSIMSICTLRTIQLFVSAVF